MDYRTKPTEELIQLAKAGDSAAIDALFSRLRRVVRRWAAAYLNPRFYRRSDPSDVANEVLVIFWNFIRSFRGTTEQELTAALRKATVLCCLRVIEFEQKTAMRSLDREECQGDNSSACHPAEMAIDQDLTPSEMASHQEMLARMGQVIAAMPERQQRALELFHLKNQTCDEIAKALRCTDLAVRSLVRHAMNKLRAELNDDEE